MEQLNTPLLLISFAILLALVIERSLEVIKCLYDYYESRLTSSEKWNDLAIKIRDKLEHRINSTESTNQSEYHILMMLSARYLSTANNNNKMVISAEKIRKIVIQSRVKVVGIVFGIMLAWIFNIDIVDLTQHLINPIDSKIIPSHWYCIILTGFTIGLGSSVLHKFIIALDTMKKNRQELIRR